MARIEQAIKQIYSPITTTRHALFGLLALSLAACSSGGGGSVVDEDDDDPENTYTVSLLVGSNGRIDPATAQTVVNGESISFTITPDDGYSIDVMGGCGGTLDGSTYTTGAVTADCTVIAGFTVDGDAAGGAANSYTVSLLVGANGSINPAEAQTVNHGETTRFTITPDDGYSIDVMGGCSGSLVGSTYTTGAITADCTVMASYSLNSYTVTPSAATNGSISPEGARTIQHGNITFFTATPDVGYGIGNVTGCDGFLVNSTYTTGTITEDCTVTASFVVHGPQHLAATAGHQVNLTWTPVPTATEYCVYVSDHPSINLYTASSYDTSISTCTGNTDVLYSFSNLTHGTRYYFIVTAKFGTDESGASAEISAMPVSGALNDTGENLCANDTTNKLSCPQAGFSGQDGDHGRDERSDLIKTGTGHAGFDFTKLDENGNILPASATEWSCVQDNHTGLMWEVKVDNINSLHHKEHIFSWYNTVTTTNGGGAGTQTPSPDNPAQCGNLLTNCNTEEIVAAVNTTGLCNHTDWRLPTINELQSIAHMDRSPAIDQAYFPNTVAYLYWSSTPYAPGVTSGWLVDFYNGIDYWHYKSYSFRIRLVRTNP